ncbi:MAG: thiamine-phosphate kinase [Thermodesulfobacteriota bacterium]
MNERISDIGEFGLIERINALLSREGIRSRRVILGIGDDAALFRPRTGYEILVTCDSLVEGRHFLPRFISPQDLGRRAMSLNISDIGAMGGRPLYALISLGLRGETPLADIDALYRGFLRELNPFEASIIGGNLTRSGDKQFIDITLIGEVEQGKALTRSGARAGDVILVSGYPGQSAAGLQLLLQQAHDPKIIGHPLVKVFNTPSHRALLGAAVARSGLATAMIDTSDGFLADLGHICTGSRTGAELIREKLPLSTELDQAARTLKKDPLDFFLGDSDDYELIITCPEKNLNPVRSLAAACNLPALLTEVGRISDQVGEMVLIDREGRRHPLLPAGWDHFRLQEA